ncbi:MAG: N-acetylmuramoyl-L-alanine amidase [Chloroflexota bacterium]|nr:N-acetylmuramoyl-L-alanine amidase [Chloroflexota bacterium]
MRHNTLQRIQRYLFIICFAALVWIGFVAARIVSGSYNGVLFTQRIALISGHAGYDSGAVCTDINGAPAVTEADVNAKITGLVAQQLRRAGADVTILDEFDSRLDGLQVDLLLSLHADSCIDMSGYKAVRFGGNATDAAADRLVTCIDQFYAAATGLTLHSDTITHNMTNYHAFRQIDPTTPAAIIELGFLGGDQELLVKRPDVVAQGVADSLLCFFAPTTPEATNPP